MDFETYYEDYESYQNLLNDYRGELSRREEFESLQEDYLDGFDVPEFINEEGFFTMIDQ